MFRYTCVALVMLMTVGSAGYSLAADAASLTSDKLLPLAKEIISKLQKKAESEDSDSFQTPKLTNSTITKDGEKVKITGELALGEAVFGKTDMTLENKGSFVEVSGTFPDWSGKSEDDTDGLKNCDIALKGSTYKLSYNIKMEAFSELEFKIKNLAGKCSNGEFDLKNGVIKSILIPAGTAGEYNTKNILTAGSFTARESQPGSQVLKEAYNLENFSFGFDIGPVNLNQRTTRIGLPYEEFWALKTPSLAFITDTFFLQSKPEKYLPLIEKLGTLTAYLDADRFMDRNFIRTNNGKNAKLFFDLLNLRITSSSDDTSNIELPNANLSVNYSRKGNFEIKASEKIDTAALSELIGRSLVSQITPADFMRILPQPLNLTIKTDLKSDKGTLSLDGTASIVGFIPNLSLTFKADNLVEDFNSIFTFKGTPDPEVKACLDSISEALKTLQPLAEKNNKTNEKTWAFHFEGMPVPGPMTINGEDPASLQLPAFMQVQAICSPVIPRIMRR